MTIFKDLEKKQRRRMQALVLTSAHYIFGHPLFFIFAASSSWSLPFIFSSLVGSLCYILANLNTQYHTADKTRYSTSENIVSHNTSHCSTIQHSTLHHISPLHNMHTAQYITLHVISQQTSVHLTSLQTITVHHTPSPRTSYHITDKQNTS